MNSCLAPPLPAQYTAIIPRADRAGPCNVAVDLCHQAVAAGFRVRLLYLSGDLQRDDLDDLHEVRRFTWTDTFRLSGLIHTHCLRPDIVGSLFTWRPQCRVVTTIHNYFLIDNSFDHPGWKTRLAYEVWKRAISRADARVAISGAMNRYYRRLLPQVTFETAWNFRTPAGSPPSALPPSQRTFVDEQKKRGRLLLAFVGVLSRRKNILPLATAVAGSESLALIVCGSGPVESALMSVAESASNIHLAGHCPDPRGVLQAADMLVLPSRAEGLPLVVPEALMCGRPALLSNIAVHRELVRRGLGATFDHRRFTNLEDRAFAVARLLERSGEARMQQLYQEAFSPQQGFARYLEIFTSLGAHEV